MISPLHNENLLSGVPRFCGTQSKDGGGVLCLARDKRKQAISTNVDTGARSERKIIGIFDKQKDAEALEQNFNAQEQETEGIVTKAFSSRYALHEFNKEVQHLG